MSSTDAHFQDGILATEENMGNECKDVAARPRKKRQKGALMSDAQKDHIMRARRLADGTTFFGFDWQKILLTVSSVGKFCDEKLFYVKPSSIWILHKLIPRYHPYCPFCEKPVPTIKYWWIDAPMIMFGMNGHSYLDTIRYECQNCKRNFRAINLKSLSLDTIGHVRAVFRIHLLKRCAVDNELYSLITTSMLTPRDELVKALKKLYIKAFVSKMLQYYEMTRQCKLGIIQQSSNLQKTMENYMVEWNDNANTNNLQELRVLNEGKRIKNLEVN